MASNDIAEKIAADSKHVELLEKSPDQLKVKGDVVLVDGEGHLRRVPIPSDDPNDPLNYSKWRKLGILICCCWFCKTLLLRDNRST